MTRSKLIMILAIVATFATSVALAGEIYRYVDEDGNVHYMDRPTGAVTEERLAIRSRPTDNAAVLARAEQRYGRDTEEPEVAPGGAVSDEPIAEEKEPTRAERVAADRERREKCEQYRDRLDTFETARRLYREDDNGERVYLDDTEIDAARAKVQERVDEFCG